MAALTTPWGRTILPPLTISWGYLMHNDLVDIKRIYSVDNVESVEYEDEDFYVYVHFRNDIGEPFYVGKGRDKRAYWSYSRNKWWNRIVNKHGYTVKVVKNFKLDEQAAFEFEKELISILREFGFELCISGKLRTHKGFTWTRHQNLNPNDFAGLEPYDERSADRLKNSQ